MPFLSAGSQGAHILGLLVPHAYVLRWWLAAELLGAIAFPLCFRAFRVLPDRGYALARIVALVLLTYALWLGGTLGLLPYGAGSALLVCAVLAVVAIVLAARDRAAILGWLRESRRYAIGCEIVFLGALLVITGFRAYTPEIANTEKPFEFSFYNAVDRAQYFAPTDPWMSGKPIAYYYVGYVAVDSVAKLTATPPAYGFNISLGLIGALTALTAFGLAANCAVLLRTGKRLNGRWALGIGALAVLLLLVIGNLEGVLEMGAIHGWNPSWVYTHLDIQGLKPSTSAQWYPDESFFGSAWRATRLGSQWNFLEFPFFSFMLGDLHPHVLALPFKLLGAGAALVALLGAELPSWQKPLRGLGTALLIAVSLGILIGVHPWDYPPFIVLLGAAILGRALIAREFAWRDAGFAFGAIVALSLLLMLPFFFGANGSVQGVQPTEVFFRSNTGGLNAEGMYLPFQHLLLFWTPLMLPAAIFACVSLARRGWRPLADWGASVLACVAVLPLAWVLLVLARHGASGLRAELQIRGWGWLTVLTLGLLLTLAVSAALGEALGAGSRDDRADEDGGDAGRRVRLLLLAAMAVAVLLVYGPELFMVNDSSGTRANSTFKLWYAAWTLLSIVGAAGGVWALLGVRSLRVPGLAARRVALGACAVVLAGALVYPLYVSFNRTDGFSGPTTLDGLAYLRQENPAELAAANWLSANVPGELTVLQADGGSYTQGGRFASLTGLPTVLGWTFHEEQERKGIVPVVTQRDADITTIYQTQDADTARLLLFRYNVQYVVVGALEQQMYGTSGGLAKFAGIGTLVYGANGVSIYRIGAVSKTLTSLRLPVSEAAVG